MPLHGLNKLTLLDYPGMTAAAVFYSGCNFRCPYCHNAPLVIPPCPPPDITMEELSAFLHKRRRVLDGVCVTGGEPTLDPDLPLLLQELRRLGYRIKLDTNGSRPDVLEALIGKGLVDYIAMDIKTAPHEYPLLTGVPAAFSDQIKASAALIMNSGLYYEFRTTVVHEYHTAEAFAVISRWLLGASAYYLQPYKDSGHPISPGLHPPRGDDLQHFRAILAKTIQDVRIRGL